MDFHNMKFVCIFCNKTSFQLKNVGKKLHNILYVVKTEG